MRKRTFLAATILACALITAACKQEAEVPEPIDMIDIFRAANYAIPVVQEALTLTPKPRVIWMQLSVRNDEAAALAEANGMKVVMNRCPKIEYGRLSSEIGWMGINSRILSSKRAKVLGGGVQRMSLNRIDRRDRPGCPGGQLVAALAFHAPFKKSCRRLSRTVDAFRRCSAHIAALTLPPAPLNRNSVRPRGTP